MADFASVVAHEQQQVTAGAPGCAQVCDDGCHGPLTCVRAQHGHDPDADMGVHPTRGHVLAPGDVSPHAAFVDGALVQWTCLPGDHDGLTPHERAAQAAAVRADETRRLLTSIDPGLLVSLLREGGHL